MTQTPLAERLRIVFAGPRNAGKSTLMNALFGREVALVSEVPGTTTDPVTRAYEIPGLGPAAITDTPGIDDEGDLGLERVRLAMARTAEADIRVLVTPAHLPPGDAETELFNQWFPAGHGGAPTDPAGQPTETANHPSDGGPLTVEAGPRPGNTSQPANAGPSTDHTAPVISSIPNYQFPIPPISHSSPKPAILVLTHADLPVHPSKESWADLAGAIRTEAPSGRGVPALIAAFSSARPEMEPTPLEGLVQEGDLVVLVTPIDLAAPAGRLIMPQVQTIRDALDRDAAALVVKERELRSFYSALGRRPKLVVTDSQAFSKVAADIPEDQMLTSFSILFARKKGDLSRFLAGLAAVSGIPETPRVMILESCSHHRQADDIGTVKIPRLFRQMVRDDAEFIFSRGLPDTGELENLHLVIHCGACRLTRGKMAVRLEHLARSGVPVTNYGLFLAWANGLIPRALEPFEDARTIWEELTGV